MNDTLEPNVVCGQHGWWQGCSDIGMPDYDPFGPDGANLNLIIGNEARGPSAQARRLATVSASIPMWNHVESLNAAIAASLFLFEAARQQRSAGKNE